MGPESVALWCGVPLAIAVALDSLELIAERAQVKDGGLLAYSVHATGRRGLLTGPWAAPLAGLFGYPGLLALPAGQLTAAAVLLLAAGFRSSSWVLAAGLAAIAILALRLLLFMRTAVGSDGSTHMVLTASTAIAVALLVPDAHARALALFYLTGQLLIAYAAAGASKARSATWRSGRAMSGILNTITYGTPRAGRWLARHPSAERAACWGVIGFECSAPLLLLAGIPGALVIIAAALTFHLTVAVLMGLNTFLWSFASAFPALLYTASQLGGVRIV